MNNQTISGETTLTDNVPSPGIPESVGTGYTANWRTYISGIDPDPNYIRAFNIPMEDIASLADFTKCTSVRAYLGMANSTDVSTLKLVLVPVDANNLDVLSTEVPDGSGGFVEQSSIYDFSTPCPQLCDIDSPLFED
ncbi:MAG: hypothetical protein JNM14_00680 [Ferruginibacter sp.]|nr:hypothetical protein [Ferruginibacter sp.]